MNEQHITILVIALLVLVAGAIALLIVILVRTNRTQESTKAILSEIWEMLEQPGDPYDYDLSLRMRIAERICAEIDSTLSGPGTGFHKLDDKDLKNYRLILAEARKYLKEWPFFESDAQSAVEVLAHLAFLGKRLAGEQAESKDNFSAHLIMKSANELETIVDGIVNNHQAWTPSYSGMQQHFVELGMLQ